MNQEYALVLHCKSTALAQKLMGVYAHLLTEKEFPYRFQIVINPTPHQISNLAQSHQCLFYVEVSDSDSEKALHDSYLHFLKQGHQLVLVASPTADYLDLAIRHQVGNILYIDSIVPNVVGALTQRLLGPNFFGFAPFFPDGWSAQQKVLLTGQINRAGLIERYFSDAIKSLPEMYQAAFYSQLSELITNALSYGVLGITSEQRDAHQFEFPTIVEVPPNKEVRVSIVQDSEKYGISVRDPGGSLTLLRVLNKLRRHTKLPGEIMAQGIEDLTGRGLFIMSRQTRLVINILHGIQTEVILLSYFDEERNRYKSLIINEKSPNPKGHNHEEHI